MSIIILGAGVIGTTLAYYLAKNGQDVTVIDRQSDVGLETSFANAGQISPGYASPWAAPGVPLKAIKWLTQNHAPLAIKPDGSFYQLLWIIEFLKNCQKRRYSVNKERMVRLANYSKNCLMELRHDLNLHYDDNALGTLQIFRTQKQLDSILKKDVPVLIQSQVEHKVLTSKDIKNVEPALEIVAHKIIGGLHLPHDETGDCYLFTKQLAQKAKELGVKFIFNTSIDKILIKYQNGKKQAYGVANNNQEFIADNVVVALGSYSRDLLKSLVEIPVYPVKGYSITADISDESMAVQSTILDETYKVAITRLNKRIRVGGMAHITGYNTQLDSRKVDTLNFILKDLFPKAYSESKAGWTGLRPTTPDGTPIIGNSEIENLWLNTGHGTLGWTMAAGSGKLLCDLILGNNPDIKHNDLGIARYK